jgi:hypothetical protein
MGQESLPYELRPNKSVRQINGGRVAQKNSSQQLPKKSARFAICENCHLDYLSALQAPFLQIPARHFALTIVLMERDS